MIQYDDLKEMYLRQVEIVEDLGSANFVFLIYLLYRY